MNTGPVIVEYNVSWPDEGAYKDGTVAIPRDEWNAMTPAERQARCEQIAQDAAADDTFGWGWSIKDERDYASTEETQ